MVGRFDDVDLVEREAVLGLKCSEWTARVKTRANLLHDLIGVVLCLRLNCDAGTVADHLLDGDLNELVEGIELLAHEALLDKVRVDHEPARGLPLGG